jgi:hypothetical protein
MVGLSDRTFVEQFRRLSAAPATLEVKVTSIFAYVCRT